MSRKYKRSPTRLLLEKREREHLEELAEMRKKCTIRLGKVREECRQKIIAINATHRKELRVAKKEGARERTEYYLREMVAYKKRARIELSKRRRKKALNTVYNRELQYIPIALAYSSFHLFVRKQDVSPHEFCFMIIINALNKITVKGMGKFGYPTTPYTYSLLDSMSEKGYLTKTKTRCYLYYSITLKGRNLVNKYKEFHKKHKIALLENDEYKGGGSTGWS